MLRPAASTRLLRLIVVGLVLCVASLYATLRTIAGDRVILYERQAILAGEWWRLLSGHLAHAGLAHWALNMAGLVVILAIYRQEATARSLTLVTIALMWWVGAMLLLLQPDLAWYLGFSGILHGVFAFYALGAALSGDRIQFVALGMLGAKLIYEYFLGASATTQTLIGVAVVTEAHLYGALGGVLLAFTGYLAGLRRPRVSAG